MQNFEMLFPVIQKNWNGNTSNPLLAFQLLQAVLEVILKAKSTGQSGEFPSIALAKRSEY